MVPEIEVVPFSADMLPEVQGFDCGHDRWATRVAEYLKASPTSEFGATPHLLKGYSVWLYFTPTRELIGFGSVGTVYWHWPAPTGPKKKASLLQAFGVDTKFQGKPIGNARSERYAWCLLADIVCRERERGRTLMGLSVDSQNERAIRLYQDFGFFRVSVTQGIHWMAMNLAP